MSKSQNVKRLPVIQDADLADKIVLVRVDHNVVKDGVIRDPYRIDRTIGTLYNIVERGGRIILMTHVGRPRNKKTGEITCDASTSIEPIAAYIERKLHTEIHVPTFRVENRRGILGIDTSFNLAIRIRGLLNSFLNKGLRNKRQNTQDNKTRCLTHFVRDSQNQRF